MGFPGVFFRNLIPSPCRGWNHMGQNGGVEYSSTHFHTMISWVFHRWRLPMLSHSHFQGKFPPLWKMMEWKSVGMMTFPIYEKYEFVSWDDDIIIPNPWKTKMCKNVPKPPTRFDNWLVVLTILKNMKVNGKDDIPYMKWKISKMLQTTSQYHTVAGYTQRVYPIKSH